MAEDSQAAQTADDFEYDEAHEQTVPATTRETTRRQQRSVYVANQSSFTGGDYGYDMAHDSPAQ